MIADALRDVVRPGDLLCATGDNEWSLLMPACAVLRRSGWQPNRLVEVLRIAARRRTAAIGGENRRGRAVGPEHGHRSRDPEHAARIALVVARQTGRGFEDYREDIAATVQVHVDQRSAISSVPCSFSSSNVLQPQLDTGAAVASRPNCCCAGIDSGDAVAPPEVILLSTARRAAPYPRWLIMHSRADDQRAHCPGHGVAPVPESDRGRHARRGTADLISQDLRTWRESPRNSRSRLPRRRCSTRCGCAR